MKAEDLKQPVSKLLKKFRKAFIAFSKDRKDEESLHQLRVSLKKIHSFLRFVRSANPDFKYKKVYKPFKKLFKESGKLRDTGQMQDYVANVLGPDAHAVKIKRAGTGVPDPDKYKGMSHKGFLHSFIKECLHTLENVDIDEAISAYLNSLAANAISIILLSRKKRQARLHELRKRLKDMQYNQNIFDRANGIHPNEAGSRKSKKITGLIGDWHDRKVWLLQIEDVSGVVFAKGQTGAKTKLKKAVLAEIKALETGIDQILNDRENGISFFQWQ